MPEPTQDPDAHDTTLARALHARSAASVEDLQASLVEARRRRALGGSSEEASLAAVIAERALVAPTVLAEAARVVSSSSSGERLLLASTERSGERLAGSGTGTDLLSESSAGRAREALTLPPQLGPYRLRRELARGGMGAVWEVEHVETGQLFALKTILAAGRLQGPGGEAMVRFRREVELGARLEHPHLARVHSADLEGDPPWLVQTYLTGGSLDERLKRQGPLPVREAASIVAKVARGLAHAHAKGVLHRDLKPPNVLFDGEGQPRVVDFGVARSLREGTMRLTATGEVLGSPAYMAPEQALGEKEVDARADVHALGALLYACLTGGPPFRAKAMLEVIEQVISRPATPPSASRPEVPPALDALVLRCLEKSPAARFQRADEVAGALEAWLAPGQAPERRSGLLAALVVLAVVAVAAVVAAVAAHRLRPPVESPDSSPPVTPSEAAPVTPLPTPVAPIVSADWLATFERTPLFGIAWMDVLDGGVGGLALAFERQGPVVVEGAALRLRLKVTRLAYAASIGGGSREAGRLNSMAFDSAVDPAREVPDSLGGPMARAMRHVNAALGREVELRVLRSSGAVLRFQGLPGAPVFTLEERKDMTGGLCERLTRYISDDNVGACLDNVLRVLPDAGGAPSATRTVVPHFDVSLTTGLGLIPGDRPGRFEVQLAPDGPVPGWGSRIEGQKASNKRELTVTGHVQVADGRVEESLLDVRFWSFDDDPHNGARKTWRSRRSRFRWAPGQPVAPGTTEGE